MSTKPDDYSEPSDAQFDRLIDQYEGSMEMYAALFKRLQERAFRHGFNSLVLLQYNDPLAGAGNAFVYVRGDKYAIHGALEVALHDSREMLR